MAKQVRVKTKYPGVYYVEGLAIGTNKPERIYYIRYRREGKLIEEKAGRQFQDDMTAARAAQIRMKRICGEQSNQEKRIKALKTSQKWTINKLWEAYKQSTQGLKGKIQDEDCFNNYLTPSLGAKEPDELCPFDIDRLRLKLLKNKRPATVRNILELLRRIINFGVKKRLCQALNFKIEIPKVNNCKTEDLTPEQLLNLLKIIDEDPNIQAANIMKMALFCGMRRGEMFNLQWQDIDFERGFIHIRDPKGGNDQKIPLNDATRELLLNHPRTDSPYVFPGRGGQKRTDIRKQVNRIKERAGLPKDFRALHGLRHTYASMLASSGQVDMYTLQKLLTHKSPLMTQRHAHLRDEALRKASNLVGDIIAQAQVRGHEEKDKDTEKIGRITR